MSTEKSEQPTQQPQEPRVEELPPKELDAQNAETIKGGSISLNYTKVQIKY